jgi:hypothetical protein
MSTDGINSFINNSTQHMVNYDDDFEYSSLVVQQMKIYFVVRLDIRPQQTWNDIENYFRPLIEDLKVLWYNNVVEV